MDARSAVGSFLLIFSLVAACSSRSSERGPEAGKDAGTRDPATATPGASAPAAEDAAVAEQAGPPVDIAWKLVPTRMEGALELTDANGQRSEVFSATLPLGCARTPETRGVLLAAQCTGKDGALQLTARRSQKELIISATGPAAGKAAAPAGTGKAAQGAQILARIPLSPDTRTIRPREDATDAARTGELLINWSFATYHDVHVVIERSGAATAEVKAEAKAVARIDEFITELAGCEQPGQTPALPQGAAATLACRHRGSTATLTATPRPGVVIVTHTVSGEGLAQHQVDAREIPLPAAGKP